MSSSSSSSKRTKLAPVAPTTEKKKKKNDITPTLKKTVEYICMYELFRIERSERIHRTNSIRIFTRKELAECKKKMMRNQAEMLMSENIVPETDPENKKIAMRLYDLLVKFGSEEDNTLPEECMCQLAEFFESSS